MLKVLMVNKFLYPNGGSETYIFELGKQLQKEGCKVEYFGMRDERNIVGNSAGSYTSNMDFHSKKLSRLIYPFKIIYSGEARRAIRKVLDNFQPDVVHLNNFNFQITPSVLYEIRKYEREKKTHIKILYTAHDYQLVCPNHMMRNPASESNCSECLGGSYRPCIKGKCIHASRLQSVLGALEGWLYRLLKTYRKIDVILCPTQFMQTQLEQHPDLRGRTVAKHNFTTVDALPDAMKEDQNYALYFGRYSKEKGMETLLKACRALPEIPFVFAGKGPYEEQIASIANIKNLGFLTPEELRPVICKAGFSIYPSEWYENCPFSVMESIQYGTPVLGADIGGIPELIDAGENGELFESGNVEDLIQKIRMLYDKKMVVNGNRFLSLKEYTAWIMGLYQEKR